MPCFPHLGVQGWREESRKIATARQLLAFFGPLSTGRAQIANPELVGRDGIGFQF